MRKISSLILLLFAFMATAQNTNPLFDDFTTIPFSKIKTEHYMPAIDRGIERARAEVDAIVNNPEAPTFENTIVAYEKTGEDLDRVTSIFFNLLEADANDEMMALSMEASQKLSDYGTDIILNPGLWQRIKTVNDFYAGNKEAYDALTPEDRMLLQTVYDSFANNGALLPDADQQRFKELKSELSGLTTRFGQNVLRELNTYEIWLTPDQMQGLPEGIIQQAAEAAEEKGRKGEYLFTLAQPTYMAVMKYADNDDVRRKFHKLYTSRNTQGEYSNLDNIARISAVRLEIARLLGKKTYADQSLQRTMAQTPEAVYDLLDRLRDAYLPAQKREFAELKAFASKEAGKDVEITAWNHSYWSNKLKTAKYSFDDEALRPYFPLDSVINGVFGLATRLYGLQFKPNTEVDVYHPDVKCFDVVDADGRFMGLLYTDFFPRASKRPGAWMTEFRGERHEADGSRRAPYVSIVMNFTKPTADKPSLLTPYEVETFLHEFGHALHGLLADTKYGSLSGTSVYRDFVELPSQFNENYLTEKEFLDSFAKHYQSGEPIPQELIDRMVAAQQYGAAYACIRQLQFGYLDMAWHTITEAVTDPMAFERDAIAALNTFPAVEGTMTSPQFSHIFSGGYAAGYYSYKWAEVLDADAFAYFQEKGIFSPEAAKSFRDNVLSRGGTENPAELYRRFRGADPTIDALLRRDGITPEPSVALPAKD